MQPLPCNNDLVRGQQPTFQNPVSAPSSASDHSQFVVTNAVVVLRTICSEANRAAPSCEGPRNRCDVATGSQRKRPQIILRALPPPLCRASCPKLIRSIVDLSGEISSVHDLSLTTPCARGSLDGMTYLGSEAESHFTLLFHGPASQAVKGTHPVSVLQWQEYP